MSQAVKQEVLSHQAEGGFEEALADLFADHNPRQRTSAETAV